VALYTEQQTILLNRNFNQQQSNTHWVGDITYIKTYQGWSYLASVKEAIHHCIIPTITFSTHALSNVVLIAIINKSLRRMLSPLI
jgi:transposase InsO family protein